MSKSTSFRDIMKNQTKESIKVNEIKDLKRKIEEKMELDNRKMEKEIEESANNMKERLSIIEREKSKEKRIQLWRKCEKDIIKYGDNAILSKLARQMLEDPEYKKWKSEQEKSEEMIYFDYHTNLTCYHDYNVFYNLVKNLLFFRFNSMFEGMEERKILEKIHIDFFKILFNMTFNRQIKEYNLKYVKMGLLDFMSYEMPKRSMESSRIFSEGKNLLCFLINLKYFKNKDRHLSQYLGSINYTIKMPPSPIFKADAEAILLFKKDNTRESARYKDFLQKVYEILRN